MAENWVSSRVKLKEMIAKLSPTDRLGYVEACIQCIVAIGQSNQGWLQWLSNPSMMSQFDEKTMKEFFEKLKQFAIQYVEQDIEATKMGAKPKQPKAERPYR